MRRVLPSSLLVTLSITSSLFVHIVFCHELGPSLTMSSFFRVSSAAAAISRTKSKNNISSRSKAAFMSGASNQLFNIGSINNDNMPQSSTATQSRNNHGSRKNNPAAFLSSNYPQNHGFQFHQCRAFHSSTMLMMAKRKKNGGKSKKPKSLQNVSMKKKKKAAVIDGDDDDDEEDYDDDNDGEELDLAALQQRYDLEEYGKDDDDNEMDNDSPKVTPFATEYHAPVMPTECVEALLLQGEWEDMLVAKKDRWRKKRSIMEAKRRRASINYDDDEDDENDAGEDQLDGNSDQLNDGDSTSEESNSQLPRLYIDGTLGGGGHSQAILQQLHPGDILIGCDVDPEALATASKRLINYLGTTEYILDKTNLMGSDSEPMLVGQWDESKPMFIPVQSNFRNLISVLARVRHPVTGNLLLGDRRKRQHYSSDDDANESGETVEFPNGANGMLLDLGVSSHQIDTGERGFAFMKDGPLDMRMSGNSNNSTSASSFSGSSLTAADICNEFDEGSLISILRTYGDEPRARRIASAIVASRPLYTTTDLVRAINSVTPTFARQRRAGLIATSARVFQALRIVVNEEDGALKEVLENVAPAVLCRSGGYHSVRNNDEEGEQPDGILAVLSYHSMEDKMAKRVIRDGKVNLLEGRGGGVLERDLYGNIIGGDDDLNSSGKSSSLMPFEPLCKPRKASDEEIEVNTRARSATLRVAIRI